MKIPLQFEDRGDGTQRFPIMSLALGCGTKGFHGKALIDTGADLIAVDETVLQNLGCPRTGDTHGVRTIHGERELNRYRVTIEFAAIEAKAEIEVTGIDLVDRHYHAIFGVPLLELGILHLNPRGENYFDLFADNLAPPR